jgi:hypothetical protein
MNNLSAAKKVLGILFCLFLFSLNNIYAEITVPPATITDQTISRGTPSQRFAWQSLTPDNTYSFQLQPNAPFSCFGMAWDMAQQITDIN